MRPLNTVQSQAFQKLVKGLSPSTTIPSQNTLRARINEEFNNMITTITSKLECARFTCSTADIWSSQNRSFLGMTAHWLDNVTLERRSVAIACKRFQGSHTFDRIAETINSVHAQFKIESNVLKTTTDNGSNFVKAFKICSNKNEEFEYSSETDEDETSDELIDDHEDNSEVVSCADILEKESEENEISLPDHQRCCSHTLNLIVTTDVKNAMKSKTIHQKAMSKCQALWNKVSRSTKSADIVQETISGHLIIPCPTRWNSNYEAVKKLVSAEAKLNDLCKTLSLPQFLQQEIQYLKEYIKIMHPLTTALTILEGEKNCYLGMILPTIIKIKESLGGNSSIVVAPLKSALLTGIETRFGKYFEDHEFVLAAVTHPKFKLSWISDVTLKAKASELFYSSVKDQAPTTLIEMTEQDSEDDFLSFSQNDSVNTDICMQYLSDREQDFKMLDRYPIIKQLFIRYNTAIPSSAPVERLFSTASIILTKRRNRLSDDLFEKLLLLKVNRKFSN